MKKIFFLFLLLPFVFSCSDDGTTSSNLLVGTKWKAVDDISEFIYGKTCTTTIEFLDNENCQTIDIRTGMKFGSGTFVTPGTYTLKQDSVIWTEEGSEIIMRGKISGSTITTTMGTISMGNRIYVKE